MSTYDKKSFLTGLAVGRQLKGWGMAKNGSGGGGVSPFPMFYKDLTSEAALMNIAVIEPPKIYYAVTLEET